MNSENLFLLLPIIVLAVTLLVTGRLLVCAAAAFKVRRMTILLAMLASVSILASALIALVIAWFAYGVAHTGKGPGTDLIMLGATLPPYLLICWGLWFVAGKLRTQLRQWTNAQVPPCPDPQDDAPP